jgi:hypothetical protein
MYVMANTPDSENDKTLSIKQISIDQLQVGMFITEGNSEWVPNKNVSRKGMVKRAEVIEQIRALGVKSLYM